jgi:Tfp pilus assembly protein PilO
MRFKSLYFWIGIPIIIAGVWFLVFYMPMRAEVNNKQKDLQEVKKQAEKVESDIKALMEMKRKEESIKASLREYQGQIPLFDNFPDFIHSVAAGLY